MRHKTRASYGVKRKEVLLMLKYWYHFIKEFSFQNLLFQMLLVKSGDETHILEILLACKHFLVAQRRRTSVKLYH